MSQLEIEVKYRVESHAPILHQLSLMGAIFRESREDVDHYFKAPDRDFVKTDEAFRLRSIGTRNFLTYKGPKRDTLTKTREEIEIPFAEGSENQTDMVRLLHRLGYQSVTVVRKQRKIFEVARDSFAIQISLDSLPEIGSFIEIEIVADESQFAAAREAVLKLAEEFHLSEIEKRSYLAMTLANQS